MKKIMTRIAALALTAALMLPAMSYASPVAEEQDMSLSADATAAVTSTITPAPQGYDGYRNNIPHGNVQQISYYSTTVGKSRNAMVYTLRVIPLPRPTTCSTCCTASAGIRTNG